jgi:hypothetical protein
MAREVKSRCVLALCVQDELLGKTQILIVQPQINMPEVYFIRLQFRHG